MGETWLTSDPHFGHALAARERGFATAQEHDRWLMSEYRRKFRDGDEVWWLGDVAFDGWADRLLSTVATLPGTHYCVLGNHDRPAPNNSRGYAHTAEFAMRGRFAAVMTMARITGGLLLSHYPYSGEGEHMSGKPDRYREFRLPDHGKTLLHGHTHSTEKVSRSVRGTLQIHVGVDAWRRPVTLYEVNQLIRAHGGAQDPGRVP